MKIIKRFVLSSMGVNSYLINTNNKVVLIDTPADIEKVIEYLNENNLKLDYVLITHTHFDHILGAQKLYESGCIDQIYVSPNEVELFTNNSSQGNLGKQYGLKIKFDGDILSLDKLDAKELDMEIAYVEGHSRQSAVYIFNKDKMIFSGDTLFKGSIGRSDLAYGNGLKLVSDINQKLIVKKDYKVYPGHGFATTTTAELNNPLLRIGE